MNREKKLESVLIILVGFIFLFFIFKIKVFLLIAFLVGLMSALSTTILNGVTWFWFKLSEILGWINARIFLALIFFIFLFPMALLMRAFGKSGMALKNKKKSYYTERNHLYTSEDLENTW